MRLGLTRHGRRCDRAATSVLRYQTRACGVRFTAAAGLVLRATPGLADWPGHRPLSPKRHIPCTHRFGGLEDRLFPV
jgi:hypothetical protein